jgi:hypothetical protein
MLFDDVGNLPDELKLKKGFTAKEAYVKPGILWRVLEHEIHYLACDLQWHGNFTSADVAIPACQSASLRNAKGILGRTNL